jgi:hypothetical protein
MHRASDDIVCLFLLSVDSAVKARCLGNGAPLLFFFFQKFGEAFCRRNSITFAMCKCLAYSADKQSKI